jgi:hypothetical protein
MTLQNSSVSCFAQGVEGDMTACVMDGIFAAGPAPGLMGLVLAGTLITSLYIAGDGTVIVPAVVTILLGSIMVPVLPPQFQTLAYTLVVIGVTVAAFGAYIRFTHQGRF